MSRSALAFIIVLAFIVAAGGAIADPADDSPNPSIAAQPGAPPPSSNLRGQPEDNGTLEIAPQRGLERPEGGVQEVPSGKEYKPREDSSSLDRNFNPNDTQDGKQHPRPCLGVQVQYTTKCFLGGEEHGLEILTVDPNSPAEHAGLRGNRGGTNVAGIASVAGAVLGPLSMLLNGALERAAEGASGDLIVAANDHRVRSQLDLEDELDKLKPGDTMYLTVIRPLPGGAHSTMKIAVKVGSGGACQTVAAAGSSGIVNRPQDDEQYAY